MRAFWVVLMTPLAAFADPLAFGLKGGVPLTDAFRVLRPSEFSADKQPYTIGPMVELHLPYGVSVELDALYKPFKYRAAFEGGAQATTTGNSWEFPLLLKYRFVDAPVRPYVGAGLAWRRFGGFKQVLAGSPGETDMPPELRDRSGAGAVLEGGLELKVLFVRISPEVRYTRWGSTAFLDVLRGFSSRVNQAEFLVGFTF